MTTVELLPRRERFSKGRLLDGADGHQWWLPELGLESWAEFESIRRFFRSMTGGVDRVEAAKEQIALMPDVAFELIRANYHADGVNLWGVIRTESVAFDQDAFLTLSDYLDEHAELFTACRVADDHGYAREDVIAMNRSPVTGRPMPGWFSHDNCLFQN